MISGCELWAQAGVDNLCEPYRNPPAKADVDGEQVEEPDPPMDLEEAKSLMRAAYGQAYVAALSEPEPMELEQALQCATTLALMLPV